MFVRFLVSYSSTGTYFSREYRLLQNSGLSSSFRKLPPSLSLLEQGCLIHSSPHFPEPHVLLCSRRLDGSLIKIWSAAWLWPKPSLVYNKGSTSVLRVAGRINGSTFSPRCSAWWFSIARMLRAKERERGRWEQPVTLPKRGTTFHTPQLRHLASQHHITSVKAPEHYRRTGRSNQISHHHSPPGDTRL